MPAKTSVGDALSKVRDKHPTLDFSQFIFKNTTTPSTVRCTKCNTERQRDIKLLMRITKSCSCDVKTFANGLTNEQFLSKLREKFGDVLDGYDLTRVDFKGPKETVIIGCQEHGDQHVTGQALHDTDQSYPCRFCNGVNTVPYTTESYIEAVHRERPEEFDTSRVQYVNAATKVELGCTACKNWFQATTSTIVAKKKTGCPICARERTNAVVRSRSPEAEALEARFIKVHGDRYTYDWDSYSTVHGKMRVYCGKHSHWFEQICSNHESGSGCPICGIEERSQAKTIPLEDFLSRAQKAHENDYYYDVSTYVNVSSDILIKCKNAEHPAFTQNCWDHLNGRGCSRCWSGNSLQEAEVRAFIRGLGVKVLDGPFVMSDGKHLDIVCPDHQIAIEYNGLRWHTEERLKGPSYHLGKTLQAERQGYRLIHIFSDEWAVESNRVKTELFLKSLFGIAERKLYARKLVVSKADIAEYAPFIEKYHLQGSGRAGMYSYTLKTHEGEVVAAMTFNSNNRACGSGEVELTRYCTSASIVGGFRKLLAAFIRDNAGKFTKIISFSDRRWSVGDVYRNNGFTSDGYTSPNYHYVKGTRRLNKRNFQHRNMLRHFQAGRLTSYDPNLTEKENMDNNGYERIWDCGLHKWSLSL